MRPSLLRRSVANERAALRRSHRISSRMILKASRASGLTLVGLISERMRSAEATLR